MSNYLSLDEAAKKLGIPTDQLVQLRSSGEVRGFRDGSSWKFPENEIARLKDNLPELLASGLDAFSGGGGVVADSGLSILDSDMSLDSGSGIGLGSDLEQNLKLDITDDSSINLGSDVKLMAGDGSDGSDVSLVAGGTSIGKNKVDDDDLVLSDNDLLQLDSGQLSLNDPAILHDSKLLDLDAETERDKMIAGKVSPAKPVIPDEDDLVIESQLGLEPPADDGSSVQLGLDDLNLESDSGLSFGGGDDDNDSGEDLIGGEDSIQIPIDDEIEAVSREASSLELMSDLGGQSKPLDLTGASRGVDVLSELDLLSSAAGGSGLISGDSENLLGDDSGLGSSLGADALSDSNLSGIDDALADDDDLVIAADDDDLVISSAGNDVSVAGDSGINLMSPSDSGLSLESEPLDLAGSGSSALDLSAELADGSGIGSGSGSGRGGSSPNFTADEEFQLSPSGMGLEADIESASQVIDIEESNESFGDAGVAFDADEAVFGEPVADAGFEGGFDAPGGIAADPVDDGIAIDATSKRGGVPTAAAAPMAYEVPFTLMQTVSLMLILIVFSIGGILMTDLVRNMWTYTEPSAPVSSLTDWLINSVGMGG